MAFRRVSPPVHRPAAAGSCIAAAALLVLLGVVWRPEPLAAHAELLRTEPAAGAILPSAPARVRLWFSEPVDPPADAVVVVGPDGARADRRDSRIVPGDEGGLDVSLDAEAQGTYVVRWRAISADSHPISGEFRFSVGQASEIVPAAVAADAPRAGGAVRLQAFARWLHLLGLALFVGPLTLLALTVRATDIQALQTSLWRGGAWGTGLLLAASLLLLTAQSAAIEGSVASGLRLAALNGLLHTRWGALWIVRVGLVGVAAALTYEAGRRTTPASFARWLAAALLVSAGLIALTTLNSHSAATTPVWLSLGVDWVHVAATVVWVGGLFSLTAVLLPAVSRLSPDRRNAVLAPLVSRFSRLALVSVELLVVTGLYHAWAQVSDPGALVATPYGRTLLIKLLLILVMLLPAAFNLFIARPRLAGARAQASEREERRFRRAVGTEAGVGVIVLATVSVLTSLPPAQSVSASSPAPERVVAVEPAVTLAAPAGSFLVTLTMGPGRLGSNHLEARVQDARGASAGSAQVRIHITPPSESQIPAWVVVPALRGDHHEATVALSPGGRWRVDVEVAADAGSSSTASFSFAVPFLGAGELLATAMERMNRLQSVHEEIDMVVDGVRSTTQVQHRAPLNYQWIESATNVVLLGRDTIAGEECFDIGYVDTRDGGRVRVWIATQTLFVLRRSSALPGHMHVSQFSRFVGPSPTSPSANRH